MFQYFFTASLPALPVITCIFLECLLPRLRHRRRLGVTSRVHLRSVSPEFGGGLARRENLVQLRLQRLVHHNGLVKLPAAGVVHHGRHDLAPADLALRGHLDLLAVG
jgi:hypothetical protein